MNVAQLIAIAFGVMAVNGAVLLFQLNPKITNGLFFGALVFFLLAQAPGRTLGFALTVRDWGDKWRGWLGIGEEAAPSWRDRRQAAHRSIAIFTLFFLIGLPFIWTRPPETHIAMQTDLSCLLGMWLGSLVGYLVAIGRREAPQ